MAEQKSLIASETGEASFIVSENDTASALSTSKDDAFPEVFATSRMIALMELAAARVMRKLLEPNQLSVGVGVNIKHLAATPKNVEVRAIATFVEMEGKLFKFKVEAYDKGGKIGEGDHTRAIVDTERLLNGAEKRMLQK